MIAIAIAVGVWRWRFAGSDPETEESGTEAGEPGQTSAKESPNSALDRLRETMAKTKVGDGTVLAELTGRGIARGVVLDLDSGERVAGVDVLFGRGEAGEETVTSDESGEFSIELGAGRYDVRAIGDRMISVGQPDLRLLPGDNSLLIELKVRRLATLRGRVVDHAGTGVSGATVHFLPGTPSDTALTKSGLLLDQVPSEQNGDFEIDVLPKAKLTLEARKGFLRRRVIVKDVQADERRGGIVIELERGVLIRGIVRDPSGAPVGGATVSLHRDPKSGQVVTADNRGRFVFEPMEPAKLTLEARAPGFAPSAPARSLYTPGQEADIPLTLQEISGISGRIVDAAGKPIEGARVRVGRGGSRNRPTDVLSDDDGAFEIEGLDRGKHWVSASKGTYATATKEGVKPPMRDIELVLLTQGSIAGIVTKTGGGPVSEFVVEIVSLKPKGVSRAKPVGESTRFRDDRGRYELSDLDPGSYKLAIRTGSSESATITVAVEPETTAKGDAVVP